MGSLCISAITAGVLFFGLAKRPNALRLHNVVQKFLQCVDVLPWDGSVAKQYGMSRAKMEQLGKVLAPLDLLIATHALASGTTLVTNNHAFSLVTDLNIEDWSV